MSGILPDCDSLWPMTIEEVRQLDHDWVPTAGFFTQRRQEIERLQEYNLPDLLHRFDDLEHYRAGDSPVNEANRWTGVSLTSGEVQGRVWVLAEPGAQLPLGFSPAQTILVARSVDAGWLPTFAQVAGVVVEIGGDLSHGSILLREIGLPAITNVRGVTKVIKTGDAVLLRAGNGVVERIGDNF